MQMRSFALLAIVFSVPMGCKQRATYQLDDYSPSKTPYIGEVVNGTTYFEFYSRKPNGNSDTGVSYGTTSNDGTFRLVDEQNENAPADDPTQQELIEELNEILNAKAPAKEQSSDDEVLPTSDEDYRAEELVREKERIARSIKSAAEGQLKYSIHGFSDEEISSAFSKLELVTFSVAKDQTPIGVAYIQSPKNYIKMNFSARIIVQMPKNHASKVSPVAWVPKSDDWNYNDEIFKNYKPCIEHEDEHFDTYRTFYYFKPKTCDFATLNAKHKMFQQMSLKFTPAPVTQKDGGSPEYNKIWEDKKLVATFVFGKYESEGKNDVGTKAFTNFVRSLTSFKSLRLKQIKVNTKTNFRAIYSHTAADRRTYDVDIQAVHVSEIGKIDYEIGQLVFGERIGGHDVFMYNGHSGYGNNIRHIEKILQPKDAQYVLFYLNGCWTYSYTKLDNANFDVISNMKPSYFSDMSQSSQVMLQGLLRQEGYKSILTKMPSRQDAIVSGEDKFCEAPKK